MTVFPVRVVVLLLIHIDFIITYKIKTKILFVNRNN